ncbi:YggS family pyridoxal phosphate-dependent enzyme [Alloacidobacterium dinghuense]|uniref:Pyridoxal phosphate homeostasis protein n=1 Tax=Alloacidobacterium dinghuense TaxID=2763107 RepID=A0A7G8BDE1_9BACT|nr:YggS family pyridoxal phosphate-dependent enzyme [Alloacidobacterium dinghuense]QNI30561.1 YggS family pyridoxal phosphate-dependent enzyme [Alloacidobacterium dinghuense]
MFTSEAIQENVVRIAERIHSACARSGRRESQVKLMAVSKTHPAEAIAAGFAAGLRLFGENRVQEFQQKASDLKGLGLDVEGLAAASGESAAVHLIGHLQSNKSARAAEIFSGVDTVDSLRLAQRLDEAAKKLGRRLPVLVEIKLSDEAAKSGLGAESPELAELLERLPDLGNLEMRGLMTVAPLDENPETARACFRRLRLLRDERAARHQRLDFGELSMGMSGDFEIAVEEGSTLVRIGTAIFGARPKPA